MGRKTVLFTFNNHLREVTFTITVKDFEESEQKAISDILKKYGNIECLNDSCVVTVPVEKIKDFIDDFQVFTRDNGVVNLKIEIPDYWRHFVALYLTLSNA